MRCAVSLGASRPEPRNADVEGLGGWRRSAWRHLARIRGNLSRAQRLRRRASDPRFLPGEVGLSARVPAAGRHVPGRGAAYRKLGLEALLLDRQTSACRALLAFKP